MSFVGFMMRPGLDDVRIFPACPALCEKEGRKSVFVPDLCSDSGKTPLKSCVERFRETVPKDLPVVIILDNLAAAMHGADENSISGIGKALSVLRDACGDATIIVIHHSGHDSSRLRGHSVLQGSCDAIIRVANKTRPAERVLEVMKQRDASDDRPPINFVLSAVDIAGRPEQESACVIKVVAPSSQKAEDDSSVRDRRGLSATTREVFDIISVVSKDNSVPERTLKQKVVDALTTRSDNPVSKEAALKRYSRGCDTLQKEGKLLRDPANQENLRLAA